MCLRILPAMRFEALFATALLALGLLAGCDKVTPVAPSGAVLTVSANPTFIEVDGESTITIIARDESGSQVNEGTEILLSTTLGEIDESVFTDARGVAVAILRGDGRPGLATVVVSSGAASDVTLEPAIQIGSFAAFVSVQATPTTVEEGGGEIELLALVRGDSGSPLADAVVNFSTPFGTLDSGGGALISDANGQVVDTLTLTDRDVASITGESFVVTAQTAGGTATLIEGTFSITVARLQPRAQFIATDGGGNTVIFRSTSTGGQPLDFGWDFTNNGTIDSTAENPTHTYSVAGTYMVRLVVTNVFGQDTAMQTVTVPFP